MLKSCPIDVSLFDYTGAGTLDPARYAANKLVFTKSTRLNMTPELIKTIVDKPWEEIEAELQYMARTIRSSWEFVDYSFLVRNVGRGFTHQFVRSRNGSFAHQTLRLGDASDFTYHVGPTIEGEELESIYEEGMEHIRFVYKMLLEAGAKAEDARGILPIDTQGNICAKFNLRTLADLFTKRTSARAQGEYHEVVEHMKAEVLQVHPWTSIFFDRSRENVALELQKRILDLFNDKLIPEQQKTDMIKLLDELRQQEG